MAIKPTLFNTPMTQAIQAGTKTVTRRVIKPQPTLDGHFWVFGDAMWSSGVSNVCPMPGHSMYNRAPCHPGDVLWVRETWHKDVARYMYKASYADNERFYQDGKEVSIKWRPSIHMPKEAARLFLRVTDVRVERLREMNVNDFLREGICLLPKTYASAIDCVLAHAEKFKQIWYSTIKHADLLRYGWDASPGYG